MIKIKGITKNYSYRSLFLNFNLEIPKNELTFVTGVSGSGKTSLLNLIAGIEKPENGSITFESENQKINLLEKSSKNFVDYISQDFNLLNNLKVITNLQLYYNVKGIHFDKKTAVKNLNDFGLNESYLNSKVSNLSSGEQQRLAVIRSLFSDSFVLLADEPTANLDEANSEEVFKILKEISKFKTVVVVSHDTEAADKYADNIAHLEDGKVISYVKTNNVSYSENTKIDYLKKTENNKKSTSFFNKSLIGIKLASQDLKRRWLVALLIITTFFIVLFSVSTGLEIKFGSPLVNSLTFKSNADVLVIKKNDGTELTEDDNNKILKVSNIDKVTNGYQSNYLLNIIDFEGKRFYANFDSLDKNNQNTVEWVDNTEFFKNRFSRIELEGEFIKNNNEIIISEEIEKELDSENLIGKTININYSQIDNERLSFTVDSIKNPTYTSKGHDIPIPLKIVGINKTKNIYGKGFSIIPIEILKNAAKLRPTGVLQLKLYTGNNSDNESFDNIITNISSFKNIESLEKSARGLQLIIGKKPINQNEIIISDKVANEALKSINMEPWEQTYNELFKQQFFFGSNDGRFKVKVVGIYRGFYQEAATSLENLNYFNRSVVQSKYLYVDNITNIDTVKNNINKIFDNELQIIDNSELFRDKILGINRQIFSYFVAAGTALCVLLLIYIFTVSKIIANRKKREVGIIRLLGASKIQALFYQLSYIFVVMIAVLFVVMALYFPAYYLLGTVVTELSLLVPSVSSAFLLIFIVWLVVFAITMIIFTLINISSHFKPISKLLKY